MENSRRKNVPSSAATVENGPVLANGHGLELALVKGMVEMHHGHVEVESPGRGKGTIFTIRLPLPASGDPGPTPIPTPHLGIAGDRSAQRLVLIEDNEDMAQTLRELLEAAGYPVEVAHSGPEGIACAQRFQPELVICDIGLPGMDGYQVARRLRREPATAAAHLSALTGYAQEEDLQRARDAGFERHHKKPVDFHELLRALQGALAPERCLAGSKPDPLSGLRGRLKSLRRPEPPR